MDKNLIYSNISLKKNKAYFLYIGAFKRQEICKFFLKPLRKYYNKNVEVIYVFPNFPSTFFKGNYIVLSNKLKKLIQKNKTRCYMGRSSSAFNRLVSRSDYTKRLIKKILQNQKDIFIKLYKDSPEFNLHKKIKNIHLLGPQVRIFNKYDDKLFQHEMADILGIPQPRWFLAHNKTDLLKLYQKHFKKNRAYITKLHGLGGSGCGIVSSRNAILHHPHIKKEQCKYIIEDFIHFKDSPTTSAIIANENEVFFNGVMDQLLDGINNLGTIYPSEMNKKIQKLAEDYTIKIARYLGMHGLKGFISLDFVVDPKNKLYFSEVNPRIGGSTLEKVYMHEMTKPKGFPSLPELEFRALTKNTFGRIKSYKIKKPKFSWAVYTLKIPRGSRVIKTLKPFCSEHSAFKKFRTTILDIPDKNTLFCTKNHLSRIVSVKKTRKEVENELREKSALVFDYVEKPFK
ncbi:ATP-grasp domain-containing protein [Candidatus Woesearchaeota archaeon]|nr:ATP-grasp domain-containing protein [Candidatus Woesearchaeota archaeon]